MALSALLLALPSDATTKPVGRRYEIAATAIMVVPSPSEYRYAAEGLGYGSRGVRPEFGAEATALRSLGPWLSLGLAGRFQGGQMDAPYDGLPPLDLIGAALGVRAEADVIRFPRMFFWAEPALGLGWVGASGARKQLGTWELRGGVGLATHRDAPFSLRLRVGYAYAPTFGDVTKMAGPYNFGGLLFALDGVFHVRR